LSVRDPGKPARLRSLTELEARVTSRCWPCGRARTTSSNLLHEIAASPDTR